MAEIVFEFVRDEQFNDSFQDFTREFIRELTEEFLSPLGVLVKDKWVYVFAFMLQQVSDSDFVSREEYPVVLPARTMAQEGEKLISVMLDESRILDAPDGYAGLVKGVMEGLRKFLTANYKKVTDEKWNNFVLERDLDYYISLCTMGDMNQFY